MQLQYLGTAAAEGIPAIFCHCGVCARSRQLGGKNIRTRSQALIDGKLLIDFPADSYLHMLQHGLQLADIRHCLVTHTHSDHFYPTEFLMRWKGFSHLEQENSLCLYGTETVREGLQRAGTLSDRVTFCEAAPFRAFAIDDYTITPLPAVHDKNSGPLMYLITRAGKTLLYAHDTGYFAPEVWEYLQSSGVRLDFVSLDCTEGDKPIDYDAHMNLEICRTVRQRLCEIGCCDTDTAYCLNHFSHNGGSVAYDDFLPIAQEAGFLVSYDGMTVTM